MLLSLPVMPHGALMWQCEYRPTGISTEYSRRGDSSMRGASSEKVQLMTIGEQYFVCPLSPGW